MCFSIFRVVQQSPLSNFRTLSLPQKETLYPLAVILHSTNLLSFFMNLPILGITYQWEHIICGFLCLASFTLSTMFSKFIHVLACISTSFLYMYIIYIFNVPLYSNTTFCLFIHQLIDIWVVSIF